MVRLVLPRAWLSRQDAPRTITVDAATVGAAVQWLREHHPDLERWLDNGQGSIPPYTHVFVGQDDIRIREGLDTPVGDDDEIVFVPEMSGGATGRRAGAGRPGAGRSGAGRAGAGRSGAGRSGAGRSG